MKDSFIGDLASSAILQSALPCENFWIKWQTVEVSGHSPCPQIDSLSEEKSTEQDGVYKPPPEGQVKTFAQQLGQTPPTKWEQQDVQDARLPAPASHVHPPLC